MIYYPHYIGDFRSGTFGMSRLERGIYRELLDLYYDSEQPLPLDVETVCRKIAAHEDAERAAVAYVLAEKFTCETDGYRHARSDIEIAKYNAMIEKQRANGSKVGRPKKPNNNPTESHGFNSETHGPYSGKPSKTQPKAHQNQIQKEHINTLSADAADVQSNDDQAERVNVPKAEPIPYVTIVAAYHAALPTMPRVKLLTDTRKRYVKAVWTKHPSMRTVERWAEYFAHVGGSDFLTGRNGEWTACDFEWIVKPSNFVKTVEGKYHNKPKA